jgi:hypothetical protein
LIHINGATILLIVATQLGPSTTTIESIANAAGCSPRKVMTISLAFLAPDLVKAAIEGRLPYGMGLTRLCELPAEWSRQFRILGLPAPETPRSN